MPMDDALRRRICRLVAGILVTDDDMDPREDKFLDKLLADFGIPAGERDCLFPIVDAAEAQAEMRELPQDARDEAMHRLLDAACADGRIMEAEREYLRSVGFALEIGEQDTDRMIAMRLSFT